MMFNLTETMMRRRRVYSLKDIAVILGAVAVTCAIQFLLKKFAPGLSDKAKSTISYACGIVVVVIGIFCFNT